MASHARSAPRSGAPAHRPGASRRRSPGAVSARAAHGPLGVHGLVWAGGWSEAEARRAMEGTREAGYDLIEIPVLDPWSIDVGMTRALLDEYGLQASCSLGLSFESDINSEDAACVARGRETLLRALEVTSGIGGAYLCGVLCSALGKYPGPTTPAARANSARTLREVAAAAADRGVTLGLEVVNRYESNLFNDAAGALEFVADVGADNVGVHLDTYHMNIEERSMRGAIAACGPLLKYLHVGESNRGYLGEGTVDWGEVWGGLADAGYAGPVTFESFSSAVVSPALSNVLCVWSDPWTDGADLARRANRFIRDGLAGAEPRRAAA